MQLNRYICITQKHQPGTSNTVVLKPGCSLVGGLSLALTADDGFKLYADGQLIGTSSGGDRDWAEDNVYSIAQNTHIVAVHVWNARSVSFVFM